MMFSLYNAVFKPRWKESELEEPNTLRKQLQRDNREIEITDLGAGSKKLSGNKRKISAIAKTSVKRKKYARLLSRLIKYFDHKTIIETGTSLGITTVYLSRATKGTIHTLEGCPATLDVAKTNLQKESCNNVGTHLGAFAETLPSLLNKIKTFDLAFIDGWHNYEGTMHQFNTLLLHATERSVIVIDDIHWSEEMEKAWNEIIKHKEITASIDIFEMGILFFDKNLSKENFLIKY